jgi:hypothetical protein
MQRTARVLCRPNTRLGRLTCRIDPWVRARGWRTAKGIASTGRSVENVVTAAGDDLAYTVDLENMTWQ